MEKTTIPLSDEAGQIPLSNSLQEMMTKETLSLLKVSLYSILGLSGLIIFADTIMIGYKFIQAGDRLFNSDLLKILIMATVVEVGTAFGVIVAYIFRGKKD